MSLAPIIEEIEYPESDGQPMGETDLHRNWMIRIFDLLSCRYRGQSTYVGCDLLLYYQEGAPTRFIVPDIFVALGCAPGLRRVFKIWEEGQAPDVAFEVTSRSTRREDTVFKPRAYAGIGVKEYFVYDPTGDYLEPALRGFRLTGESYTVIEPDQSGVLPCQELGLGLCLEAGRLVMHDVRTGQLLLTEAEAERQAREAAEQRAATETAARHELEEEVRRLRAQLKQN